MFLYNKKEIHSRYLQTPPANKPFEIYNNVTINMFQLKCADFVCLRFNATSRACPIFFVKVRVYRYIILCFVCFAKQLILKF